ncbi:MAG: hypothetical protein ABI629_23070 [bacterium]
MPAGTLVWANSGLAVAVALGVLLLVSAAGIVAMREQPKPLRRLSVVPLQERDARLPKAA